MSSLNKYAYEILKKYTVHCCTDVTGMLVMLLFSFITLCRRIWIARAFMGDGQI